MKKITVDIDDELLRELEEQAQREKTGLEGVLNRVLRQGLAADQPGRKAGFRQEVFDMGEPLVNLDKALQVAADLEDEEIIRKLSEGR